MPNDDTRYLMCTWMCVCVPVCSAEQGLQDALGPLDRVFLWTRIHIIVLLLFLFIFFQIKIRGGGTPYLKVIHMCRARGYAFQEIALNQGHFIILNRPKSGYLYLKFALIQGRILSKIAQSQGLIFNYTSFFSKPMMQTLNHLVLEGNALSQGPILFLHHPKLGWDDL